MLTRAWFTVSYNSVNKQNHYKKLSLAGWNCLPFLN